MASPASIRWDIVEEHLDEAAFLSVQWERALVDPDYVLAEVAEGPEERMLAHLDGLVVAGRRAADRRLVPALADGDPGVVFAAAFALLASEDGDFSEPVVKVLSEGEPEQAEAVARALQLAPRGDLVQCLGPVLAKGSPLAQSHALAALAFRRMDPGMRLDPLAASKEAALRRAVLRVGRVFPERIPLQLVEYSLASEDAEERVLAIEVGLVLGVKPAWAACDAAVREAGPQWGRVARVWALSGESDIAPLAAGLDDEARRKEALFALGFSGRAAAVDAALGWVEDEKLGKLAAEAMTAVTGIAIEGVLAALPERWDPDAPEEDEEPDAGPESDLPAPDPEVVRARWEREKKRFDPAQRWLGGKPWSIEGVVRALEDGPMRRRSPLALDLAVRSRGQHQLEAMATARRQAVELAEIRHALPRGPATYRELVQAARPAFAARPPA